MTQLQIERPLVSNATAMVNMAVVGYGYWGPNLVRNFLTAPLSTVHAVCDLDERRLATVAKLHPGVQLTTDFEEVLRNPRVDGVAIATAVSTHYDLARRALEAGKHVWVEKPLTFNASEAACLGELAERKNLTLMVDHTFVYTPAVQRLKTAIDNNELGDLLYYDSVRVNLGIYQHDVNVVWDLGIHDLAVMDYLVPHVPVAISATGACHIGDTSESIAYVTVYFQHALMAHFNVNWLAPVKIRLMTICGRQSMAVYDDVVLLDKVRIYDRGVEIDDAGAEDERRLRVEYRTGDMYAPKLDQTEALQVAARHFADCVISGSEPITNAAAGMRAVAMAEAAQLSLARGGQIVPLAFE